MIFFDIDGTLIDQQHAERIAARGFLRLYGHELPRSMTAARFCRLWRRMREKHSPRTFADAIGAPERRRRRMRELFALHGIELTDRELDARVTAFQQLYRRSWQPFADVTSCLDSLAGRHRLGVISNGHRDQQLAKLRAHGLLERFSVIVIAEEVGAYKPDPAIFAEAARRARTAPEQCAYIGDRLELDARPAALTGFRTFWLDRTCASAAPPEGVQRLPSLSELPGALARRADRPLAPARGELHFRGGAAHGVES